MKWFFYFLVYLSISSSLTIVYSTDAFDYSGLFASDSEPHVSKEYQLQKVRLIYGQGEYIQSIISSLYPRVSSKWDPLNQYLFFKARKTDAHRIKNMINQLDKQPHQVKVEVQIVEVAYTDFDHYKQLFSQLSQGIKLRYDGQKNDVIINKDFTGELSGLIQNGSAKVLAKPVITTLENKEAVMKVGDRIPYVSTLVEMNREKVVVNHIDTGIDLILTPRVLENDRIEITIKSKISSVKLWKNFGGTEYPILSNREAETNILLLNNETIVIAGLIDQQEKENISRVPFLSSIPLLGSLFQSKRTEKINSDILFMITPKIVID